MGTRKVGEGEFTLYLEECPQCGSSRTLDEGKLYGMLAMIGGGALATTVFGLPVVGALGAIGLIKLAVAGTIGAPVAVQLIKANYRALEALNQKNLYTCQDCGSTALIRRNTQPARRAVEMQETLEIASNVQDLPSPAKQFCNHVHDAAITAATYDPGSGTVATADASGVVVIQRCGETRPVLVFQPGGSIDGALTLFQGGTHVGVGDSEGTVGVYCTDDGSPIFQEFRGGSPGLAPAVRGIAISPGGTRCAAIAVDGLVRMWDLVRGEREVNWSGFGGETVEFDSRSERLLCLDEHGQIRIVALTSRTGLHVDRLQAPASHACFTRDDNHILAVGCAGVGLIRVVDGRLVASFATRGGIRLLNLLLSPQGDQAAVVTNHSTHIFSLPDLEVDGSNQHGAPDTSGAAVWTPSVIRVGGNDGRFYSSGMGDDHLHHDDMGNPGTITAFAGSSDHQAIAHSHLVAYWAQGHRQWELEFDMPVQSMSVDRDGRLMALTSQQGPIQVIDIQKAQVVFTGGPETIGAKQVNVGGPVVAVKLHHGGVRWWHLARNQSFNLSWPTAMTLSSSGVWMAVVTPHGTVRILDPTTGKDAVLPPTPLADVPVEIAAFVSRGADLLVLDRDGVLGLYDLVASIRDNAPAVGRDIIELDAPVDAVWGIAGGLRCAMRLPDVATCSVAVVEIATGEVTTYIEGLPRYTCVCEETGSILNPARTTNHQRPS